MGKAATVLAVLAVLAPAGLTGCSAQGPAYVVLTKQSTFGVNWQLDARADGKHGLCLTVDDARGPGSGVSWTSGACGFDLKPPDDDYYADAPAPGSDTLPITFGPLPERAVRIRIATNVVIPTYPLPAGKGLPAGRYWIFTPPSSAWPDQAQGTVLATPVPLDAAGNPVPFESF
ncbi:hypothetical protein [Streptacidiphilus sp. PAMC 29251]